MNVESRGGEKKSIYQVSEADRRQIKPLTIIPQRAFSHFPIVSSLSKTTINILINLLAQLIFSKDFKLRLLIFQE